MHARLVLARAVIVVPAMHAGLVLTGSVSFTITIITRLMLAAAVFFAAAINAKHAAPPRRKERMVFGFLDYWIDGVMECWSTGLMDKWVDEIQGLQKVDNRMIHYSTNPSLQNS